MERKLEEVFKDISKDYGKKFLELFPILNVLEQEFFIKLKDLKKMTPEIWKTRNLPYNLYNILMDVYYKESNQYYQNISKSYQIVKSESISYIGKSNYQIIPQQNQSVQSNQSNQKVPSIQFIQAQGQQPNQTVPTNQVNKAPPNTNGNYNRILGNLFKTINTTINSSKSNNDNNANEQLNTILNKLSSQINDKKISADVFSIIDNMIKNIIFYPDNQKYRKINYTKLYNIHHYDALLELFFYLKFKYDTDKNYIIYNEDVSYLKEIRPVLYKYFGFEYDPTSNLRKCLKNSKIFQSWIDEGIKRYNREEDLERYNTMNRVPIYLQNNNDSSKNMLARTMIQKKQEVNNLNIPGQNEQNEALIENKNVNNNSNNNSNSNSNVVQAQPEFLIKLKEKQKNRNNVEPPPSSILQNNAINNNNESITPNNLNEPKNNEINISNANSNQNNYNPNPQLNYNPNSNASPYPGGMYAQPQAQNQYQNQNQNQFNPNSSTYALSNSMSLPNFYSSSGYFQRTNYPPQNQNYPSSTYQQNYNQQFYNQNLQSNQSNQYTSYPPRTNLPQYQNQTNYYSNQISNENMKNMFQVKIVNEKNRRQKIVDDLVYCSKNAKLYTLTNKSITNLDYILQSIGKKILYTPSEQDKQIKQSLESFLVGNTPYPNTSEYIELKKIVESEIIVGFDIFVWFPDNYLLKSSFYLNEKIDNLYNVVIEYLKDQKEKFYFRFGNKDIENRGDKIINVIGLNERNVVVKAIFPYKYSGINEGYRGEAIIL